jgi:hypothetical protein
VNRTNHARRPERLPMVTWKGVRYGYRGKVVRSGHEQAHLKTLGTGASIWVPFDDVKDQVEA